MRESQLGPQLEPCENCGTDLSAVEPFKVRDIRFASGEVELLGRAQLLGREATGNCPDCGWTWHRRLPVPFEVRPR